MAHNTREWPVFPSGDLYFLRLFIGASQAGTEDIRSNNASSPSSQWFRKVLWYFVRKFGIILLIGNILVFVSWKPLGKPPQIANLSLRIVPLVVFFIQATFNAWHDWSPSRVMASISTMLPDHCVLLWDGQEAEVYQGIFSASLLVISFRLMFDLWKHFPTPNSIGLFSPIHFHSVSQKATFTASRELMPILGSVNCTNKYYLETHNIGMQGPHCVSGSAVGVCC